MKRLFQHIKDFSGMMLCFIIAIFIVKIIEIVFAIHSGTEIHDFSGIVYGNLISCGFISVVIFLLFSLMSFLSKKLAEWTAAFLFGTMLFGEIGLLIYHKTTGMLIGKELIIRPLWESLHTVQNSVSPLAIIGAIALLAAFTLFTKTVVKRSNNNILTLIMTTVMLLSTPLFFALKPNQDKNIVNKTWFCIRDCFKKSKFDNGFSKSSISHEIVEKYKRMFPERNIIDDEFPVERFDNIENSLGPYFRQSDKNPNVVIIIVESLGADIFGVNEQGYTYTPFLDSLSKNSLLWTNCISTTSRSFGAVPAITGSVPHGKKGFQFGDIPEHNSLFSILANNDYATNVFYSGNLSFDKVYDYLVAQKNVDMAPLYENFKNDKIRKDDYTYWGYHDDVMFKKSLDIIKNQVYAKPKLNVFITISQHDNYLKLHDAELQQHYYDEAENIISNLPDNVRNSHKNIQGHLAAMLYGDDAIKHFFKKYNELYDENTIFVITGDHSLNINSSNPLDAYHVPLVIWSPLLEKHSRFESLVSHNDITPSLTALLRDNFGVGTPETVHWIGDGLNTSNGFDSKLKTVFLRYDRVMTDFVYNKCYFSCANGNLVYMINPDLSLEKIENKELADDLYDKFNTLLNVDNYVYSNNHLTKNPIFETDEHQLVKEISITDSVFCASNKEKPSSVRPTPVAVYNGKIAKKHEELKVILTADIKYEGIVWQDQFINLVFECSGNRMSDIYSSDVVSKFIVDQDVKPGKWNKLEFSQVVRTENSNKTELRLYLLPQTKDELWNPKHNVTLKNVNVKILATD